jgi:hypothetical protein
MIVSSRDRGRFPNGNGGSMAQIPVGWNADSGGIPQAQAQALRFRRLSVMEPALLDIGMRQEPPGRACRGGFSCFPGAGTLVVVDPEHDKAQSWAINKERAKCPR